MSPISHEPGGHSREWRALDATFQAWIATGDLTEEKDRPVCVESSLPSPGQWKAKTDIKAISCTGRILLGPICGASSALGLAGATSGQEEMLNPTLPPAPTPTGLTLAAQRGPGLPSAPQPRMTCRVGTNEVNTGQGMSTFLRIGTGSRCQRSKGRATGKHA